MSQSERKDSILKNKLLYTAIIVLAYMFGRCVPLYGINTLAHAEESGDMGNFLIQVISGDVDRRSLFALGISPYMIASILVQMVAAIVKGSGSKSRVSQGKINRMTLALTVIFAFWQAVFRVQDLPFAVDGTAFAVARAVSVLEMITGAVLIVWMADRNRKYGFGGQTILIYINIVDGMMIRLSQYGIKDLMAPLFIAVLVMIIVLVMEGAEKRIPVQRITIHNIYADKNYLAMKLNPVGAMPVMFAAAFLMLPQMLVAGLYYLFPENGAIGWWRENLVLTKPLGIGAYLLILYMLTIGFAMIMLHPGDAAEQLQRGGDSIPNIHAGKDTKRYLSGQLCRISLFSATVMGACLGIPMCLQLNGIMDSALAMFPASVMMLTSMWYNLYQEFLAIRGLDAYKPFI